MGLHSSFLGSRDSAGVVEPALLEKTVDAAVDRDLNLTAAQVASAALATAMDGGSKLTVGPNIKLKGVEITDCDTLVVEGLVEATMKARVIQIAEEGAFKGSAEFDFVTVRGQFDGDLTVRQTLVIHATGKVQGKIQYSRIVIEESGQISGMVSCGAPHARRQDA